MSLIQIIVIVLMFSTLAVLVMGVGLMMTGGRLNEKYAGKLMIARVSLQAVTVLLVGALMLLHGK